MGKPQSFVSKFENRERRLDVVELLELSEALNVDPCEILESIREEGRSRKSRAPK
jgi:transcriptional regulator with XRE-family HTH domain